jgi:hypothetical protein
MGGAQLNAPPNNQVDSTVARMLAHQWRGGQHGYLWTASEAKKPKPNPEAKGQAKEQLTTWCPAGDAPLVPSDQGRHGVRHIYWSVHPTTTSGTQYQRAKKGERDIAAINSLFSEFDLEHFGNDPAALRAHVENLSPAPSVYWDSGKGGIQALWPLDEPFILDTPEKHALADWVQKAWVDRTHGDDGAKDLNRVLRLPGTKNYKAKYGPDFPAARFLKADFEQLNSFEELAALVPALPEAKVKQARQTTSTPAALVPDDELTNLDKIAEIVALLQRLNPERADAYNPWLNIGMICKDELGAAGLPIWKAWAQQSGKYEPGCCEARWPTFNSNVGGQRVTIASLRHWATEDDPPAEATASDSVTVQMLVAQVKDLHEQVETLEAWRAWTVAVAALPTERLSPAAKIVAVSLWPEMQSRRERGLTDLAPIWIGGGKDQDGAKRSGGAKERAGLSEGTYSTKLKELADVGALAHKTDRDPVTGNSKVLIAPADWNDPAAWAPPEARNHGGQRPNAGRPALPLCPEPTCSPETPVKEAAVMTVEYTSACGTPLGKHERSRRERTWAPDQDGHWTPSPWKRAEAPPDNQPDCRVLEEADLQDALPNTPMDLFVGQIEGRPPSPHEYPPGYVLSIADRLRAARGVS